MPEHGEDGGHGRRRDRRGHHNRDGQRDGRDRRETQEDDSNDDEVSTQTSSNDAVPNFNQLAQAMNTVVNKVQGVEQKVTEMRNELNTTQGAVLELKDKIKKPEEPKKTEEAPKPAEPPKPAEVPKPTTAATPAEKPKSFFESVGNGFKKIGELSGKIIRAGIELVLSPLWAGVKILQGTIDGISKSFFNPPKKTA